MAAGRLAIGSILCTDRPGFSKPEIDPVSIRRGSFALEIKPRPIFSERQLLNPTGIRFKILRLTPTQPGS